MSAYFMQEALKEAEMALRGNEIPVGCVIVNISNQEIISRGHNQTNQTRNGTK